MSLQGQIEETGLGPIIQTLSLNRYRGTLRIETETDSQFFFISEGEIVLVRQVKRDPVRLGDLLVAAGLITDEQLTESLSHQRESGRSRRLGETMIDRGYVTAEQIEKAVRDKFEEDFLDLFLLDRGRFEFIFGLTPEALFGPDERLERITLSTSSLMMEAMRRVDEWQEMITDLGNFDTMFRNRLQSQVTEIENYDFEGVTLPKQTRREIYDLLDGTRSLREVISSALEGGVATRLQTFLYLHALQANQLIRPLDFKPLLVSAKDALSSGDVSGAAKFIRAVLSRKERLDLALVERYLRFLQDQQRPRLAFSEARRFAARSLADEDHETAIKLYELALGLYRSTEVIDRLFYALLRANQRERAIQVGVQLRDQLQAEGDLALAQRILQNLLELAPDQLEVIELRGLILKRQERNEEALEILDRALQKCPDQHPRRAPLIAALRELAPDREDLRDAQEHLELQQAREQVRRERRLRWLGIGGTIVVSLLIWRGYAEWSARGLLAQAERVLADAGDSPDSMALRRASVLLGRIEPMTTVSGRASELTDDVSERALELDRKTRERVDELIRRQQKEAKEAELARARAQEREALRNALTTAQTLAAERNYEEASKAAIEIRERWPSIDDPELAREASRLRVFVRIESKPSGAKILEGDESLGKTPCEIPLVPGKARSLRLRRAGYRTLALELDAKGYAKHALTLSPGATWTAALGAGALDPASTPHGPLIALPQGELALLSWADGSQRWRKELPGEGPVTGLSTRKELAVVIRGRLALGISIASGTVEWKRELPPATRYLPPGIGDVLGQETVIVASEGTVCALELGTGSVLLELSGLPSPPRFAPTSLSGWAQVVLEDRVVGFALAQPGGRTLDWAKLEPKTRWEKPVVAAAPLVPISTVDSLVAILASGELRVLDRKTGVTTPIAPGMGPLVGVEEYRGSIYCLAKNGQLASYRSDGLEVLPPNPIVQAASGGPVRIGSDLLAVDHTGLIVRFSLSGKRRKDSSPIKLGQALERPLIPTGDGVLIVADKVLSFVEPQE